MEKITEIIPDDLPTWMEAGINNGTYFKDTLKRITDLEELVIWMTGCGYDFAQHEYFCRERDRLLKQN